MIDKNIDGGQPFEDKVAGASISAKSFFYP